MTRLERCRQSVEREVETVAVLVMLVVLPACIQKFPADPDRLTKHERIEEPIDWPMLEGPAPKAPPVDQYGLSPVLLLSHGLMESSLVRAAFMTKAEVVAQRRDEHGLLLALNIFRRPDWTVVERKPTRIRRLQYLVPSKTIRDVAMELLESSRAQTMLRTLEEMKEWADLPADGVVIDLREPVVEPRGMIIWYHSLGGLSFEEACLGELQRRGWLIAVAAFPWGVDKDLVLPLSDEYVAQQATKAAALADRRLATAAYAAEAIREYAVSCTPELANKPLVLWGASAGSFCTPAVAVRLGEAVDAVVLIGSGSNLMAVSQGSTFFDGGMKIAFPDDGKNLPRSERREKEAALRQSLMEKYEEASVLDPAALAQRLCHVPVLMLHGKTDTIVPEKQGEILWERLGKPERWVFSWGHQALFWRLSSQSLAIADWVDSVTKPESGVHSEP
jgi:pimeloyl-ACP methyl ester carboxylesterase